jgi:ketosteroid isomerase-like protein
VSRENVELVRRSWEAWERGDMEAIFAFYDPDIVWDQFPFWEGELASLYRGHDGIRQLFREWLEAFEGFYAHAEDFIDAGDAVVVRCRQGGRGKQSGAEVRMPPFWLVYRLRDGRAVRIEAYADQGEALEAVGLGGVGG